MSSSWIVPLMPRLRKTGLRCLPRRFEQRIVLRIPRTDLEDVGVFADQVHVVRAHNLGDNRQPGLRAALRQILETFFAQTLEAVGAGAGFVRTARRIVAPASLTCCAVSRIISRLSTLHGPAITTIRLPPTWMPLTSTTVLASEK